MPESKHDNRVSRPPVPREHGAWGILGGAFLLTAALTGTVTAGMILLVFATIAFYFSRHALLGAMRKQPRATAMIWCALFALAGTLLLGAAAHAARYWRIFIWFALLIPFLIAEILLIRSRKQQSFAAQLVGTAGLAATAPLSYIVYTPGWSREAGIAWLIAVVFFIGLIIFVRFQIEVMICGAGRAATRRRYRLALICYHAAVLAALGMLALVGSGYQWTIAVFAPAIGQAFWTGISTRPVKTIRRLGWLQMANTILFAVLAAVFLRK